MQRAVQFIATRTVRFVAVAQQILHARRTQVRFNVQATRARQQARQVTQHAARITPIRTVRCAAVAAHQTPLVPTIRVRHVVAVPHTVAAARVAVVAHQTPLVLTIRVRHVVAVRHTVAAARAAVVAHQTPLVLTIRVRRVVAVRRIVAAARVAVVRHIVAARVAVVVAHHTAAVAAAEDVVSI